MKKAELVFNTILLPVDFFMLVAAGIATYLLRTEILSLFRPVLFTLDLPFGRWLVFVAVAAVFFVVAYAISGLYSLRTTRSTVEEALRVIVASSAGIMAVIVAIFLSQELFNSRFLVLGGWLLAIVFVLIGRALVRRIQKYVVAYRDYGVHKVMIIGDDPVSEHLAKTMREDLSLGYRVVKHLVDPEVSEVRQAAGNPGVDEIVLTNPHYPQEKVLELLNFANDQHIIFKYVPNMYQTLTANADFAMIRGVPVIELKRTALDGWGRVLKRVADIIGAAVGLVVLSPLFAVIAFMIKWETRGPVFVRLKRISRNREFDLCKFRSMLHNAEALKASIMHLNERKDSPLFKMKNDPRVTRVGRWLRRSRLDEFPQLWNVLKGEMSLVGPRPHQPDEIAKYRQSHKRVLAIKAGVTGMGQTSGSSDLPFDEEVALDTFYMEHWSLWLDIKIILRTFLRLFFDRSAA